ncbi:ciprofloxacin tolerance protein AciT [Acinetobacter sp. TSRC1-2]|uniref:ciprofloxacin tolerance protein AciT n=1 Tax=unclassified Acinetobacter TaxID=196816 RepID=UPI003CEB7ED4
MVTANLATIVGLSLIAAALIAVFFSPYRRLLSFMFAGMLFWGLIEVVRFGTQVVFELPVTYSYLTALMSAMVVVAMLLVREDRRAERALNERRCIEHTPVYEEDQQHCSSR